MDFNPNLEAKIQEITVQCEKEEFVELLENLDQNETNFDYNTGKSLADPLFLIPGIHGLGSWTWLSVEPWYIIDLISLTCYFLDIYHPERIEENMYI